MHGQPNIKVTHNVAKSTYFRLQARKTIPKTETGRFRNIMLLWCCVFVIRSCSDDYSRQTYVKPLSQTCMNY